MNELINYIIVFSSMLVPTGFSTKGYQSNNQPSMVTQVLQMPNTDYYFVRVTTRTALENAAIVFALPGRGKIVQQLTITNNHGWIDTELKKLSDWPESMNRDWATYISSQ